MLDFAYGELQLKPDEFWRLTWGEFYRLVRGYNRRVELERHKTAALFVQIRNAPHTQKRGNAAWTIEDFINDSNESAEELTEEERKERAAKAIENTKRFEKGVVKQVI